MTKENGQARTADDDRACVSETGSGMNCRRSAGLVLVALLATACGDSGAPASIVPSIWRVDIPPPPAYLIIGQSNAGWATPRDLGEYEAPYDGVHFWARWERADELGGTDGWDLVRPLDLHGAELSWARGLPDGASIVKVWRGKTSVVFGMPAGSETLARLLSYAGEAEATASWRWRWAGVLVVNGEGDATGPRVAAQYGEALDLFVGEVMSTTGAVPVTFVRLAAAMPLSHVDVVRAEQERYPWVDADGLGLIGVHYDSPAQLEIGRRVAKQWGVNQ